jgi:heavy metal sensor kinase
MTAWWRSHSVRMRLTLWHVAVMSIVLFVYSVAIFALISRNAAEALDDRLRADFNLAVGVIDRTPDGMFVWNPPVETSQEEELLWVQVWSADGRDLLFQNFQAMERPVPESARLAAAASDRIVTVPAGSLPMHVLSRRDAIYGVPVVVQVARSEAAMRDELRPLAFILLVGLPLAVAVAGFGGYVLAKRALAPVEQMTEQARLITAERLAERLPVDNPDDEVGRLASVFNETLGRLEESFEQMRRFTADVSHELRTPLTSIRSVGEVGLRGHRDEAAYRTIVGSMLEEADRLASLVDRLLALSRAESTTAPLVRAAVDLRQLADDVAADLDVLAEEKGQSVVVEGAVRPEVQADRDVLRQAVINLVDNAIKFSPAGGAIRLRVAGTPHEAVVEVVDSGRGIAPGEHGRIFDRFYRGAETEESGAGLGLSIAKNAVEASGGRLTLAASGPGGSTFRMSLPRAAKPARGADPVRTVARA